jgi:hypothetical protein
MWGKRMSKICVLGQGYIGFSNALPFANNGHEGPLTQIWVAVRITRKWLFKSTYMGMDTLQKPVLLLRLNSFISVLTLFC